MPNRNSINKPKLTQLQARKSVKGAYKSAHRAKVSANAVTHTRAITKKRALKKERNARYTLQRLREAGLLAADGEMEVDEVSRSQVKRQERLAALQAAEAKEAAAAAEEAARDAPQLPATGRGTTLGGPPA
ncbi:uncharacterized protein V1510DRAFT_429219 [Dipodascopsis tothii]|uniref:uncharacterized protein n=1 Tax=Dipodascopsis tothii TaxID=44089 RepID=UPI0034CE974A